MEVSHIHCSNVVIKLGDIIYSHHRSTANMCDWWAGGWVGIKIFCQSMPCH